MSSPTTPADGWPAKKQPEKENMKGKSNEKTSQVAKTPSNGAGKIKYTESDPSIGEFEDELYAEAVREEQELVFHLFSKTAKSIANSVTPTNSTHSNESSTSSKSFDDTRSLRIDPVKGSGHEARVFANLADDTDPKLPELNRSKDSNGDVP